jgi:hypothetical protein
MEDGELGELARAIIDAIGGDAGRFPIGEGGEEGGFPGEGVRVGVNGEGEGEGEEGDEEEEEKAEVAVPANHRLGWRHSCLRCSRGWPLLGEEIESVMRCVG